MLYDKLDTSLNVRPGQPSRPVMAMRPNWRAFAGPRSLSLGLLLLLCACSDASRHQGGGISPQGATESSGNEAYAAPPMAGAMPQAEPVPTTYDFSDDLVTGDLVRPDGELLRVRIAATDAPSAPETIASNEKPATAPDVAPTLPDQKPVVATDATPSHPILVYTASFLLSVYEVDKAQRALKAAVAELGGFVSVQSDTAMTLRVPADRFERALTAVETSGKVRARNVQALDVTEQYRDLGLRLSTAETLRTRLEAMLARAQSVEDALRVEKELERIVREIEQIKGTLRSLHDRIAYSTLTIEFRPESRPDLDDSEVFQLPYPWLDELGLHYLLELAR